MYAERVYLCVALFLGDVLAAHEADEELTEVHTDDKRQTGGNQCAEGDVGHQSCTGDLVEICEKIIEHQFTNLHIRIYPLIYKFFFTTSWSSKWCLTPLIIW